MANLFWVGGTGNWDNTTNHFATSSGGTATVAAPASGDNVTFDGSSGGGTVTITASTIPASGSLGSWTSNAHTGTINTNGKTINVTNTFSISGSSTRTVTLGASAITCGTWTASTTTGLTFNANTSTITMNGAGATFAGGGLTYNNATLTGSGTVTVSGANTFATLTRTGTATKTDQLLLSTSGQTCTTSFTANGNSATNRLLVASTVNGGSRTITAAATSCSNVDFQDITGAGAASWNLSAITGLSGDCTGNSGITFTSSSAQTWSGTTGGNWSANAWSGHVPLPQDFALLGKAWSASQTITADMPRLSIVVSWSGATGSPTWSFGSTTNTIFGSVILASGMTISGTNTTTFYSDSVSTFSITSAGVTWTQPIQFITPNGNTQFQLADDFSCSNTVTLGVGLTGAKFSANGHNGTSTTFAANFGCVFSMSPGNTWTLTATSGTVWTANNAGFTTCTCAGSTIIISGASSSARTFAGGNQGNPSNGQSYGTLQYNTAGSTGSLTISDSNAFDAINFSDSSNARTLTFQNGKTTTINNGSDFNVVGTSGKLMTVNSDSSGTPFTLSAAQPVNTDYIALQDCTASGCTPFFGGTHSTNTSGNTNWNFTHHSYDFMKMF